MNLKNILKICLEHDHFEYDNLIGRYLFFVDTSSRYLSDSLKGEVYETIIAVHVKLGLPLGSH